METDTNGQTEPERGRRGGVDGCHSHNEEGQGCPRLSDVALNHSNDDEDTGGMPGVSSVLGCQGHASPQALLQTFALMLWMRIV